MKAFFALVLIIGIAAATCHIRQRQADAAGEEATANEAAAAAEWTFAADRVPAEAVDRVPQPLPTPAAVRVVETSAVRIVRPVSVARHLEPLHLKVFSSLDDARPHDLVIPLEVTRERILGQKNHVDRDKHPIYDAAAVTVSAIIDVAEERTKALQQLVQAASKPAALDSSATITSTSEFFVQGIMRRWEEERRRRKPAVDQLLAKLRKAEDEYNRRASPDAPFDSYEPPQLTPVNITADGMLGTGTPLVRGANNQQRVIYPWRRAFYNLYGYPAAYK